MRYGELKRILRNITSKELEEDKLINRKVYRQVPPKVEYSLTKTGKELIPFIDHLGKWGELQMEKENIKHSTS